MTLFKFYTADYQGEMVTESMSWRSGNKDTDGIFIPKSIINEDHSGTAFILGNGKSRLRQNLTYLHGQTGGADGIRRVGQTYGCNMLFQDFSPTFLICTNPDICKLIAETDYCEDNIVYSTKKNILQHPGKFHLYPYWHSLFAGPAATRLACADGHKKVYLLGFDFYDETTENIYPQYGNSYIPYKDQKQIANINEKLISQMVNVMTSYNKVQFYHVFGSMSPKESFVEEFNWLENCKSVSYPEFVNLASIGAMHQSQINQTNQ